MTCMLTSLMTMRQSLPLVGSSSSSGRLPLSARPLCQLTHWTTRVVSFGWLPRVSRWTQPTRWWKCDSILHQEIRTSKSSCWRDSGQTLKKMIERFTLESFNLFNTPTIAIIFFDHASKDRFDWVLDSNRYPLKVNSQCRIELGATITPSLLRWSSKRGM